MPNKYLLPLYKELYDENFSYDDFPKRLKMQKAIYLLQEMGVPVGDYGFSWYKYGPYSQTLLDDMYRASLSNRNIQNNLNSISEDSKCCIKRLKEILTLPNSVDYSLDNWAECLGSLHYLREHIFSNSIDDKEILDELKIRKKHLNNDDANSEALKRIKQIFS